MRCPEEFVIKNRDKLKDAFLRIPVIEFFIKMKESFKHDFVKISEESIMKDRNCLRNDIVRFHEELIMKNIDRLRIDFLRIPVELFMNHKYNKKSKFCNDSTGVTYELQN